MAIPQAVLIDGRLIITTALARAGTAGLSAYVGGRRLGGCAVQTPADRGFTCQLKLAAALRAAPITLRASLRVGREVLRSQRAARPIAAMAMPGLAGVRWLRTGGGPSAWRFACGPFA